MKSIRVFLWGLRVIVTLIVLSMCTTKIKPGYVGVVYSLNGGIKGQVLTQGLHVVNPLYKVTSYSVATEQGYLSADSKEGASGDDSFLIPTSDGKQLTLIWSILIILTVSYYHKLLPSLKVKMERKLKKHLCAEN